MIINEKGLAKLLADEYRSGGYCVWTDGYTMWLRGGGWLAGIDTDRESEPESGQMRHLAQLRWVQ